MINRLIESLRKDAWIYFWKIETKNQTEVKLSKDNITLVVMITETDTGDGK